MSPHIKAAPVLLCKQSRGPSPVVQGLGLRLSLPRARVQSPVRELRPCKRHSQKRKKKKKKGNKNLAFIEHILSASFFPFFISLNPHYTHQSRHFSDFTRRVLVISCLFNLMRGGRQGFKSSSNKPHFKT